MVSYRFAGLSATLKRGARGAMLVLLLIAASAGCDDPLDPNTGTVRVTINAVGADLPASFSVKVGSQPTLPVRNQQTVTLTRIAPGTHTLSLTLPTNCQVTGGPPTTVTVLAGRTVDVLLEVRCTATTGLVRVSTTTGGTDLDTNGYLLTLVIDGERTPTQAAIPSTGAVEFSRVRVGEHAVMLTSLSPNCDVPAGVTQRFRVGGGDTIAVLFSVACAPVTRIAYTDPVSGNIVVISSNGTNVTAVTNHAAWDESPAWSPDGRRIAFVSNRDGNDEIYVMDADGSNPTRITNDTGGDGSPAWSPDGSRIAFVSDRGTPGRNAVWVMNADGTSPLRVTEPAADTRDGDPAWSPDGTTIAFTRTRAEIGRIFMVRADGTGLTNWTAGRDGESSPAWSPDGKRLAVTLLLCGFYSCHDAIGVRDVAGGYETRLGFGRDPAWSADGRQIAFEGVECDYYSSACKSTGIKVARADGTFVFSLAPSGAEAAWR